MLTLHPDVALEPLGPGHAERMYAWMQQDEVRDGIGLRTQPSPDKTREWIHRALEDPTVKAFAVTLGGTHVGNVILDRRDSYLGTARLSIYIGEPGARGRGVGTTAVYRAAQFAFGPWGLHKLWLTVHEENHPAVAAYERVGFVREGRMRDEFLLRGRRLAALYMGLLRTELPARRDESLEGKTS